MSCCIAIGFFELPGLAGGFLYTKISMYSLKFQKIPLLFLLKTAILSMCLPLPIAVLWER